MNATMNVVRADGPIKAGEIGYDRWGPNHNGWEFELTNTCGHDLIFVPEITANVASCPRRIASGATGFLKWKSRADGGPANCNFAYRHPDHLMNSGGIAIAVQTITYMQR